MKKILTLLTGIVLLITVLAVGGCKSATTNDDSNSSNDSKDLKKVIIYVKAVEKNDGMHLEMYDSNDTTKVVDTLVTIVEPGTKVIWKLAENSGIKRIKKIGPKERGEIIIGDANRILFFNRFKLKIPDNEIKPSTEEKYDIVFVDKKDKKETPIDPYLKIR